MTDPQPDFKAILTQLHHNLNILLEREARYAGSAPLDLLNQLDDHRAAIDLTQQAGRGTLPAAEWREKLKPLLVAINGYGGEAALSLVIGDVSGGIIGSKIAGGNIIEIGEVRLNIVPIETALGHPLPQRNLPALRRTLQTALPHLDAAQQAATRAALEQLEQQLAALPQHEAGYLQRVRAKTADMYVELSSHTTETDQTTPPLSRSDRRRRERAQTHYCELVETGRETKQVILNTLRAGADKYPTIILLGDPGSGKTSALRHLAHQFAAESGKYIPLFLRLSEFGPGQTLEAFIHHSWRGSLDSNHWAAPELADNLSGYLEAGRLFILFDALNEMPYEGYPQRALALRKFSARSAMMMSDSGPASTIRRANSRRCSGERGGLDAGATRA